MAEFRSEARQLLAVALALLAGANGAAGVPAGGPGGAVVQTNPIEPVLIVDSKNTTELRRIDADPSGFRVGVGVNCMEPIEHDGCATAQTMVIDGMKLIDSSQAQESTT